MQPHERGQLTTLLCSIIASASPSVPFGMRICERRVFINARRDCPGPVLVRVSRAQRLRPRLRAESSTRDASLRCCRGPGSHGAVSHQRSAFALTERDLPSRLARQRREGDRQRNSVRCATVSHKLVPADLAETRHPGCRLRALLGPTGQVSPCVVGPHRTFVRLRSWTADRPKRPRRRSHRECGRRRRGEPRSRG